jgi:hypothetical protein
MRSLGVILCCLAASACSSGAALFGDRNSAPGDAGDTRAVAATAFDSQGLRIYLETMQALIEGDAVVQAEVFESTMDAALTSPTTTNRLRYALALATPGHAGADPVEAERRLSELLAAGETLLPEERTLATIHLQEVEERLILDTAAQQQRQRSAAEVSRLSNDSAERLQAAQEENRRLRTELDEAQEKLDAITNIERSIRERDGAPGIP